MHGDNYLFGKGVPEDAAEAANLFRRTEERLRQMPYDERKDFIETVIKSIRSHVTIETRTKLYGQLAIVAKSDGLHEKELSILNRLRNVWEIPESVAAQILEDIPGWE